MDHSVQAKLSGTALEGGEAPPPAAPHRGGEPSRRPAAPAWPRPGWGVAPLLLALLAGAAFAPVLANGFVFWDDEPNFVLNSSFQGVGWAQTRWAWTTYHGGVYQPLGWMLLGVQSALWGLEPRGYHLASVLMHALNAVALYALTVALLERCLPQLPAAQRPALRLAAALAVALFAVHPLRTEAVAWVSCQTYLPCVFFYISALHAYLRAHPPGRPPRPAWLVASFGLFVAALLCKATAVSLPAVLLILDVYPLRRLGPGRWRGLEARRAWLEKVPFVVLSVVFMALAVRAKQDGKVLASLSQYGPLLRIADACYGIPFYLRRTLVPVGIAAFYAIPDRVDWAEPRLVLSLVVIAGLSAIALARRWQWPGLLAVWLSYLAMLAPNLGLVQAGRQFAADRYCYLASMGWFVLAAYGLFQLLRLGGRRRWVAVGTAAAGTVWVVVLMALSWRQCAIWGDSEALWRHALAHGAGRSAEAHNFLGHALFREGRYKEALRHQEESVRLERSYPDAYLGLGTTLGKQKKFGEAEAALREAVRLMPYSAEAHQNLGVALVGQGKAEAAIAEFREALRLRPDFAQARLSLEMLQKQGRNDGPRE